MSSETTATTFTSLLFSPVTDKTQNITGYWGTVDTTTTFCEPHYSWSPYFAEFVNAWSSLIYVVVGSYVMRKFANDDDDKTTTAQPSFFMGYLPMAGLWLVAIGLGSFLFHGTMRYSMQLLDELPMVGLMWSVIMHKATSKQHAGIHKYGTLIQIFISLQAVTWVTAYLYLELYEVFLHGFTAMVFTDAILAYLLQSAAGPSSSSKLVVALKQKVNRHAVAYILVGKAVWELENHLCPSMPSIWPMHTIWHLFSAASAYHTCYFGHLCQLTTDEELDQIPELIGWTTKRKDKVL
jgi:dihydroceramidase